MARALTPQNTISLLRTAGGRITISFVAPPAVAWLTITGTTTENQTLTAALGGGAPVVTTYQWLRGYTPISGATSSTYVLGDADVGRVIRVVANGDQYSAPTAVIAGVNDTPTGSVTISGTATQGQTLTAVTTTIADPDGLGPFSYQWRRAGTPISGATAVSYTLVQADVGSVMSVVVSWTDQQGFSESLTSENTSAVANVNDLPTGSPVVSGVAETGQVLSVATGSIADADGLGTFAYQWLRGGSNISGATSSTYTTVSADADALISCRVSWTDGGGTAESLTSNSIGPIVSVIPKLLIIAAGESNSGGSVPNADLTGLEAAARSVVQMWNVSTNVWQDLDIGSNNNLDHFGLSAATHGIENELANATAAGRFVQSQVHYLQTGQGGSLIAEWDVGAASGFWTKFVNRYSAARASLTGPVTPVVFYTQGINDAIRGQAAGPWKTATIAHLAKIRALIGANTLIVMTKFRTTYGAYNTAIDEIVAADSNCRVIQTRDSTGVEWQVDGNHWTYVGMKSLCQLFIDAVLGASVTATPSISPASGNYTGAQTVSISGAGNIRYSTDGRDPNIGTVYSGAFSATPPASIEARSWETGKASSAISVAAYTVPAAGWNTAEAAAGSFILSDGDTRIRAALDSWLSCRALGSKSTGRWYFEILNDVSSTNGFVMLGLANAGYSPATYAGNSNHGTGIGGGFIYRSSAFTGGSGANPSAISPPSGTVYHLAIDFDAGKVWFGRNNVWAGGGDPAAGTNQVTNVNLATTGPLWPVISLFAGLSGGVSTTGRWKIQGGASGTTYTPPSGFSAWA